jgi:hypothetical protein
VAKERSDGGGDDLSSVASRKGEAAFHKISMRALASRCCVGGFFAPDGSAAAWRQNLSGRGLNGVRLFGKIGARNDHFLLCGGVHP